jgi:hypothetical protein
MIHSPCRQNPSPIRIGGVVTTVDEMERYRAIATNVSPILKDLQTLLHETVRSLPLLALSFVVFAITALFFNLLASWSFFWNRVLPNPFLAELLSGAIRVAGIFIGLITALNFMGATALIGAILGGAGVLGIAIGFAVRDGLENYISSVMLSIRQPFRANEHVVIDGHEGKSHPAHLAGNRLDDAGRKPSSHTECDGLQGRHSETIPVIPNDGLTLNWEWTLKTIRSPRSAWALTCLKGSTSS